MDQEPLCGRLLDAEDLLEQGDIARALALLESMVSRAEAYVAAHCPTTETVQWFSFPTFFERLAYKRVEDDPRELKDVGEPLDRLYADYAYAQVRANDLSGARGALAQAVRWNPMECAYRLDLAELYLVEGNQQEWLALSFSVFERASYVEHLVQAYVNFAKHYAEVGQDKLQAACLAAALRLGSEDVELAALAKRAAGTAADPKALSAEEITGYLGAEGIPEGANAEVALCLIMCAGDASELGDERAAWGMLTRARELVGDEACMALAELLREADNELAQTKQTQREQAASGADESSKAVAVAEGEDGVSAAVAMMGEMTGENGAAAESEANAKSKIVISENIEDTACASDEPTNQLIMPGGEPVSMSAPDVQSVELDEAAYTKERSSANPFVPPLPEDDALGEIDDA